MGLRRTEGNTSQLSPAAKPIKRVVSFDDSSIRKMLRSAYTDFIGEELELQMKQDGSTSTMTNMSFATEKGWADLSQLQNRAELKLFWDMFIQKQILVFEQESALLIEVSKEENW